MIMMLGAALTACAGGEKEYDATGTFEATEITVSAEQNGRLMKMDINEGDPVAEGTVIGLIDTVQLSLKAQQVGATRDAYAARRPDVKKQIAALQEQIAKAEKEYQRFAGLAREGAVNQKTVDDVQSQLQVLRRQEEALRSSLGTSTNSLNAQMSSADLQRLQVADQLAKCYISSPITGTVLDKYMEAGEFAAVGKPLFKVADTSRMFLRAYLTAAQLKDVKPGQRVKVFADYGDGERTEYEGKVTWISSKSEFTPKTVLTDDERADLVYAAKIAVKNDGGIKIGMYGEVKF